MKFPLLLGVGGVIVLATAYLLGREGRTPGAGPETAEQQSDFGYVALDAEILQTADDGSPLYAFSAARIEQNPGSGDVTANALTLHYSSDAARNWTLAAREGHLPGGSTRIRLQGDVQAQGMPPRSQQMLQINTQALDYDTHTQDLTTRQPVTITWGGQKLSARGLTANLKQDQLRLESSVHGHFTH